jgi:hypothetical protein
MGDRLLMKLNTGESCTKKVAKYLLGYEHRAAVETEQTNKAPNFF